MRDPALRGIVGGQAWNRTTRVDAGAERPPNLAERRFAVTHPNRVADLTYIATGQGFAYAVVIDVFSPRIACRR